MSGLPRVFRRPVLKTVFRRDMGTSLIKINWSQQN